MVFCKHRFAYLVQVKNLTWRCFQLCLLVFFDRTSFSEPNTYFFQKFESSLEVQRAKRRFSDNPGHNILELYKILVQVRFTTSISSIANLVYDLAHELPNDLRLKILRNQEILEKSQIWEETKPSAQFLFKKFDFDNSNQKLRKNGYQNFLFLSNITGFLYFIRNILSEIVGQFGTTEHLFPFITFFQRFLFNHSIGLKVGSI